MINLFNTEIEALSVHIVGNKSRNEKALFSEEPYRLNDQIRPLLKAFFLKPFREKEEQYFHFAHEVDLEYNDMFKHARTIFENPDQAHHVSKLIVSHLHAQSNHPHIKNGEVYVAYLKNVALDNTSMDAIGIFKSEIQSDFLQVKVENGNADVDLLHGIALDKLDKGCIIFNTKSEDGYKIMSVDSNRYDARYWLEHFLSVDAYRDEHFITKNYLKLVEKFGSEVVFPAEDKKAQVLYKTTRP